MTETISFPSKKESFIMEKHKEVIEMNENRFVEQIEQLRSGEIDELLVEQSEFRYFEKLWLKLEDRMKFCRRGRLEMVARSSIGTNHKQQI